MAIKQTTLVLPGLLWPEGISALAKGSHRSLFLNRALARSNIENVPGGDISETLFHLFGVNSNRQSDLPVGAVSYVGHGEYPGDECVALVTPVHILADRDRVILIGPNQVNHSNQFADHLIELFNSHFKEDGLYLTRQSGKEWYLILEQCPQIVTSSIESVIGRHIEEYLPQGKEGSRWRGILNEIQMLLFNDKKINHLSIPNEYNVNALWFSGFGVVPKVITGYSTVYTNHSLAKGLANLSGISHKPIPQDFKEAVTESGEILIVLTTLLDYELDSDIESWKESWIDISRVVESLLLNQAGRLANKLVIYPCNGTSFSITKSSYLTRFWRKNIKLGNPH
ncbi:MAG: hypothetical protein ABW098_04025 [Candidatus Thiodiazotropha sp.]